MRCYPLLWQRDISLTFPISAVALFQGKSCSSQTGAKINFNIILTSQEVMKDFCGFYQRLSILQRGLPASIIIKSLPE